MPWRSDGFPLDIAAVGAVRILFGLVGLVEAQLKRRFAVVIGFAGALTGPPAWLAQGRLPADGTVQDQST